ncbi:unnamed protein product [Cochlearia groenlandica]
MTGFGDGGGSSSSSSSTRVSIPEKLRETIESIREITGKLHSDEDIYAVYKDSFNDPHETAQKLLFLDTFHEVRSKKEKKKENLVPITQVSDRIARRYSGSTNTYQGAGNGRSASFKRENGVNRVTGGGSAPTRLPNGVSNHKVQDDVTATVNNGLVDAVEQKMSKEVSEQAAAYVSVSVVQNHTQAITSAQSSSFGPHDPSLISGSHSDQVTGGETAFSKGKAQTLLKSDVGEQSHVTFPLHLKVAEVVQNGLKFGSFDSNFVVEASSNNGASSRDYSNFESSHGTGDDEEDSSPNSNGIPGVAYAREGASSFLQDKDSGISNSTPEVELVRHSDHTVPPVEDELKQEALSNPQAHQISYGQEAPFTTPDQRSVAAAVSQQATHLFRPHYPPSFFPYGPYYSPYYMPPPPYIHQILSPNGIPQQSYFAPGATLAPPARITTSVSNTDNPSTTNPSPHASSTVATHIPSATALNSIYSEERTSLTESAAAWNGHGLGNLQVSPMYSLSLQGQPLGFSLVQTGHSGLMGIHQPSHHMAAPSTTYLTLTPPPPHSTMTMAEPNPDIGYQQPQAALTNRVNNC